MDIIIFIRVPFGVAGLGGERRRVRGGSNHFISIARRFLPLPLFDDVAFSRVGQSVSELRGRSKFVNVRLFFILPPRVRELFCWKSGEVLLVFVRRF